MLAIVQSMGSATCVRARLSLVLMLASAGCARPQAPQWTPLAPLLATRTTVESHSFPWRAGRSARIVATPEPCLTLDLARKDWRQEPGRGWFIDLDLRAGPKPALELEGAAGLLPFQPNQEFLRRPAQGAYTFFEGKLLIAGEEPPPDGLVLRQFAPTSETPGTFLGPEQVGSGLVLLPFSRTEASMDLPPHSALTFGLCAVPWLACEGSSELVLRVRLDGELLHESRHAIVARGPYEWLRLPLPEAGRHAAHLEFELTGALGRLLVLDPRLSPADIGRPGRRPWDDPRPDLILFVADTLRADSLTCLGGQHDLTPELDAFAQEGLLFRRALASATWTMPSHAAMFSGFHPPQMRATAHDYALSSSVTTVAERLAAAGYRTGAISDGGFVSARYGFDQGFALFSERPGELSDILADAEAFRAADDGRPSFLFVHTYRTHWPYHAGEEVRARLGASRTPDEILDEAVAEAARQGIRLPKLNLRGFETTPALEQLASALELHYRTGCAELDRTLGPYLERLRADGFFAQGALLFTSDHGESFAEHGALFHGSAPHEELVRIPMILVGKGVPKGVRDWPVSHVDLAPTFAQLAGVAGDADWVGHSLLSEPGARALVGFEASGEDGDSMFVLEDQRKLLLVPGQNAPERWPILGAFDLARDPHERNGHDAADTWVPGLVERHRETLAGALRARVEGRAAELDAEKDAELEHLGY